ncbi:hypothetical protein [Klebsiella oxytoca]|uniref:hypothetical protein n=1 Tax=Klebsiella oxytoca TaxID=571 RepID=UPI00109BA0EE|nr:hypothetical protein [Klebsiella oxytoca]
MNDKSGFSFMKIGAGAKVTGLRMKRNVMVVDDLSHVESFVTVGERGEVINLDADGNELHTPDSYREKLKIERGELQASLEKAKEEINSIDNDITSQKIKNQLSAALSQPMDAEGEWNTKRILQGVLDLSKQVGCGVLTAASTHYLGVS